MRLPFLKLPKTIQVPALWRHYPWLLGLFLAPILHGAVNPEGKALVAALFGISLLLLSQQIGGAGRSRPVVPRGWRWLALALLIFPLIPLPAALLHFISPQQVELAQRFPIDATARAAWLPATLSFAATIERLVELALVVTAFWLARTAAAEKGFAGQLAMVIALALAVLAVSDLWFRYAGRDLWGLLWPDPAGHAAGTFANRNHFANWIYAGALFVGGCILRERWPLRTARAERDLQVAATANNPTRQTLPPPQQILPLDAVVRFPRLAADDPLRRERRARRVSTVVQPRDLGPGFFLLALALLFGTVAAMQTGSRGGLLALGAGALAWIVLLVHRSRSSRRWWSVGGLLLLLSLCLLAAGDLVLDRFQSTRHDAAFKMALWHDALRLALRFPLLGSGPGTFAIACNHFKTFGGDNTFLHAENEYVQLLVEHGIPATLVFLVGLGCLLGVCWRFAWREQLEEPELIFGALAALTAFGAHALVEFVFQISANAILAATLLGFVCGIRDKAQRPAVPAPASRGFWLANLGWSVGLLVLAAALACAFIQLHRGLHASSPRAAAACLRASLRFWPWATERQLALVRLEVQAAHAIAHPDAAAGALDFDRVRSQLLAALARDPYHWELRLERAWFDLSFAANQELGRTEAWEAIRLNPRQPRIALEFARYFADRDPDLAWRFLELGGLSRPDELREALRLSWKMAPDTSRLWSLTTDNPVELQTLANFAAEQRLPELAAQARQRANLVGIRASSPGMH